MKVLLTTLLSLFLLSQAPAQSVNQLLQEYYDYENYDQCIEVGENANDLDAEGHFFLGLCYYSASDDRAAIKSFDRSLRKNRLFAPAYYFKGNALLYLAHFDEAIQQYDLALSIEPETADYLSAKGDAYYHLAALDSAIANYEKALQTPGCPASTILMLGQAYSDHHLPEKALVTYYRALEQLDHADETYDQCMYNIGTLTYQMGRYSESEKAFGYLLDRDPKDYQLITKLIQVFYAQEQYERGNALKQKLYAAFQRGDLPYEMVDRGFCFDQFDWEGRRIYAYEQFSEDDGLFYKHIFYITSDEDEIEMTIQTEHSQAVRMTGKQFVLGKTQGDQHYTYFDHLFEANFQYDALKKAVIKVLRGKTKPSSSFSVAD